jgi:hypothetical protein
MHGAKKVSGKDWFGSAFKPLMTMTNIEAQETIIKVAPRPEARGAFFVLDECCQSSRSVGMITKEKRAKQ